MVINTGGRTDTVQYYTPWLLKRLEEGFAYSRNPLFPHKVNVIDLRPSAVDCLVFCSKDYRPILPHIKEIAQRYPIYCHFTITAYGKDIEPGVPSIETSITTLKELSSRVGKQKVAWRYDPVLLTEAYTFERHFETFAFMARELTPFVDRCIFSFVEEYKKLEVNMPELISLSECDKERLARGMGKIAGENDLRLQTCATETDYSNYGIHPSGCMTLDLLGAANGITFKKVKHKGMRKGCHCIESRGLGSYDTCPNGCRYCYANKSMERVRKNVALHDPNSPLLIGNLHEDDILQKGTPRTFRIAKQPSLFDV